MAHIAGHHGNLSTNSINGQVQYKYYYGVTSLDSRTMGQWEKSCSASSASSGISAGSAKSANSAISDQ